MTDKSPPGSVKQLRDELVDDEQQTKTNDDMLDESTGSARESDREPTGEKPDRAPEGRPNQYLDRRPRGPAPIGEKIWQHRDVQLGLVFFFVGFMSVGTASGYILYTEGFAWEFSLAVILAFTLVAAGIAMVFSRLFERIERQHAQILRECGLDLPGLDPEQKAQLRHHQELIDALMDELPEHRDNLKALEESVPTEEEQIRRVAESQRQIWQDIEDELKR